MCYDKTDSTFELVQAVSPENSTGGPVVTGTVGARSQTQWLGELDVTAHATDYDAGVSRTSKPRASNRRV